MIVAVHQPNYLPYLGFFHKMALADVFVLYDTAQFSKNDFHNRNRIKTPRGAAWLTVPVHRAGLRPIGEVAVDGTKQWAENHRRTLLTNYAKAKHLRPILETLEEVYRQTWDRLASLNESLIRILAGELGIGTKVLRASSLDVPEGLSPSERLAEITRRVGGDAYLSGGGGLDYLEPVSFEGLELLLQRFRHPHYPQMWGPFVENLSAVDAVMNLGGRGVHALLERAGGTTPWPS